MRAVVLTIALCWLPIGAAATDLVLGAEFAVEWDDNVLSRAEDTLEDFSLRYGPRVELNDGEGRLRWRARYNPDYQDFMKLNDLDGWDHDARLVVDWDATPNTTVHFVDQYIDVARYSELIGEDPTVDVPLVGLDRQGLKRNFGELSLDHLLGRRHLVGFTLSNTDSDFEGSADTNFWLAQLNYTYVYSPRTRLGWILSLQQQQIDREVVDTVETNYYNLSLQWIHEFDPTLTLSVSAGPALIDRSGNELEVMSEGESVYPLQRTAGMLGPVAASSCPTLEDGTPVLAVDCDEIPLTSFTDLTFLTETTELGLVGDLPDESTTDVTYFAALALVKRWTPDVETSLRYSRSAVTTGGQGGQVRDLVLGTASWRPLQRLRVVFTASWENRDQTTEGVSFVRALASDTVQGVPDVGRQIGFRAIPVDRSVDNVRYAATLSIRYQLTAQASIFSRVSWYQQEIEDSAIGTRETSRFRIVFGVSYFFEPIGLPI